MPSLIKFIGIATLCYAAIIVWMYFSQRKMLYYPKAELVGTPEQVGIHHDDVWLTNSLGGRIHGWWMPHETARFTVLFAHGNGGNVSHRLETIRILHRLGVSTFIYDYSGYGQSDGEPSEQAMQADAAAAWDWLVEKQGVAPGNIILFGRSLGGAVSADLAGRLAERGVSPAGMVLESTFTSVPDMGSYIYPWLPVRMLASFQYDSVTALKSVSVPILFAHSQTDDIVPYAIGIKLYDSYRGPKSFFELTGDHNYGYLGMGEAYPEGLGRFIKKLEEGRGQ